MKKVLLKLCFFGIFLWGPAKGTTEQRVGILVMAHGGSEEWNQAVQEAVAPLSRYCPTEVAFGMAEPATLQEAVNNLEAAGSRRIAVVRLFTYPNSFRYQTEFLLGLRNDPPKEFVSHAHHSDHHHESTALTPIERQAELVLSTSGLADSPLMSEILVDRVSNLSTDPANESVLLLGHGTGDDKENRQITEKMMALAEPLHTIGSFRKIQVRTLREDWPEKRKAAEEEICAFVADSNNARVIVVPFRLYGFGPYADVLKGLDYAADECGLLPHLNVTRWLKNEAAKLMEQAGWGNPFPPLGKTKTINSQTQPLIGGQN